MKKLSLIVPSYHKEEVIREDLIAKINVLNNLKIDYELILVIDGDSKLTLDRVNDLRTPNIIIITYPKNQGKGYAVRTGFEKASGKYVGYLDADLDIEPEIIERMYKEISSGSYDIVYPNKYDPESTFASVGIRKLYSKVFRLITKLLFNLDVEDTQTGAKMYRSEVIKKIIPYQKLNSISFEVEIFVIAKRLGFNRYKSIPVKIHAERSRSTMKFRSGLVFLRDLFLIFLR